VLSLYIINLYKKFKINIFATTFYKLYYSNFKIVVAEILILIYIKNLKINIFATTFYKLYYSNFKIVVAEILILIFLINFKFYKNHKKGINFDKNM